MKKTDSAELQKITASPVAPLPDWLPEEAWEEFQKMRKQMKKPLTEYAGKLVIKKLAALALAGNDPQEVLDQSIMHGWQGVFAVKPQHAAPAPFAPAGKFDPTAYVNRNRRQ